MIKYPEQLLVRLEKGQNDELKKDGANPKVSVNTWELYDKAFSFPRVRRYDFVQQHMDMI